MNNKEAIEDAVKHLKEGNIILFPTDTIWGLSCDATNEDAINRLLDLKGRDNGKSFIVLLNSDRMVNQCVKDVPEVAWDMMDLSENPLSLVLDSGQYVAPNTINSDGSIAIRMIKNGDINDLLYRFNKPIVSTSANISGEPTPINFKDIGNTIKSGVDYTYPFHQSTAISNSPSKIIRIKVNGEVEVLRK